MNPLQLFRHGNGSTRRPQARRLPVVEALEGRQLLSGIQGRHIGASAMVQGAHIGTSVVSDGHVKAMIQGAHIGTSVASDVAVMRKH